MPQIHMQAPEEKLGSFYLGAEYDLSSGVRLEKPVHYDARDLTTHAVCVGMTGSGKTGLCVGLLEEAALDRVPVILIDPKGDMTNLLLQFPDLLPEDFLPWINEDDARRKGKSAEELASSTAMQWKKGLADWGITSDRIRQLGESAEYTIYTPGSDAGIPVSILGSLAAPHLDFEEHAETIRERISGTASALLGLAGIKADPARSRESILLAAIFEHFWKQGKDLDLALLITSIQAPPVRQVGVFDVDTFYPEKERFELAMAFNNLIASPSFQSWLSGDPLDIDLMLYMADGKPRHSIFYLAHLPESERMFFVTLLLENLLTWTRAQSGTSSLRAMLYFDEVFGYLPPVAEPPSKRPLLTLLKQARAFGVGCVLVTQNPVDLDYKGLTNTGTWFIGRLQAERDKQRVLEGLKSAIAEAGGAGGSVDYDSIISKLGNRIFLLHNVHEDRPVIFQTRWAMSFLSGPMTRPQIKKLMASRKSAEQPRSAPAAVSIPDAFERERSSLPVGFTATTPGLDPSLKQLFVPVAIDVEDALERHISQSAVKPFPISERQLVYEPMVIGSASVMFTDRKRNINENIPLVFACDPLIPGSSAWQKSESLAASQEYLEERPDERGRAFAPLPETLTTSRKLAAFSQPLADWLYYNCRFKLSVHPGTGLFRQSGESERDFAIRLQQAARETRDSEVDALEKKFATQLERLAEKINKEERELAQDEVEHQNRKASELVGLGESVLGFFLGRKSTRSIGSALTRRRMTANAKADIEESLETIEALLKEREKIGNEMKGLAHEITMKWEHPEAQLVIEELAPRRSDVTVHFVAIGWLPFWRVAITGEKGETNIALPAYKAI
ncbi:DUF87 domain-containing protein [Chlorobium sp.]|uniref:ATP-binding protein n=2 Tax=Chlorobium sp. TaxID=1095 RepID=UPI0034398F03